MSEVLIVGLGNIGYRHLQAVCAVPGVESVLVVEPNAERREQVLQGTLRPDTPIELRGFEALEEVRKERPALDLVISAVTANLQADLASELAELDSRSYLLEKPVADSPAALSLVCAAFTGRDTWVNCVRNAHPGYRALLTELSAAPGTIDMEVWRARGGFGCNGVHFLELFRLLTGAQSFEVVDARLTREPNKRGDRFEEFSGSASVRSERGDKLSLHFGPARDSGPTTVRIQGPGTRIEVDETNEAVRDLGSDTAQPWQTLLVSRSTRRFLEDRMSGHDPRLPRLAEAAISHAALYACLARATGRSTFHIT